MGEGDTQEKELAHRRQQAAHLVSPDPAALARGTPLLHCAPRRAVAIVPSVRPPVPAIPVASLRATFAEHLQVFVDPPLHRLQIVELHMGQDSHFQVETHTWDSHFKVDTHTHTLNLAHL